VLFAVHLDVAGQVIAEGIEASLARADGDDPVEHIGDEILATEGTELDGFAVTRLPQWHFDFDAGRKTLLKQLGAATLAGYGCEDMEPAIAAAGALLESTFRGRTPGSADLA